MDVAFNARRKGFATFRKTAMPRISVYVERSAVQMLGMLQVVSGLCFPSNPHFANSSAFNYTWLVEVLPLLPAVPHTAHRASLQQKMCDLREAAMVHYLYR